MKKLCFLFAALMLSITASANGWYFNGKMFGSWKGWSESELADYKLTETESGVYELDFTQTSTPDLSSEFLIVEFNDNGANWSSGKIGGVTVKAVDTEYSYSVGGNNNSCSTTFANAKIILNTNNKTIKVTTVETGDNGDNNGETDGNGDNNTTDPDNGNEDSDSSASIYDGYYVNIVGTFNSWKDNGLAPDENGLTKHESLAIGTKEFKVKIWNGSQDVWLSTGGAIATDKWVTISGNADSNMTIAGASADEEFNVEFDLAKNAIRITSTTPTDYTPLYVNIVGDFNEWTYKGVHPDEDGVAECSAENVNTSFKVKVYDPATEVDSWYSNGSVLVAGDWNDIDGNIDGMTLPETLQEGKVLLTFNCKTKQLYVQKDTSAVEAIAVDSNVAPVYYNLQGVRVENPSNGMFIVVRGNNVAKELVK